MTEQVSLTIVLQTIPDLSPLSSYGTATKPLQSCLVRYGQPDFIPVYKPMTKKDSSKNIRYYLDAGNVYQSSLKKKVCVAK